MEETLYLLKPGEIMLKGKNRSFFERVLKNNLKRVFKNNSPRVEIRSGRFYLSLKDVDPKEAEGPLRKIFGVNAFAKAVITDKDISSIEKTALSLFSRLNPAAGTSFKIKAKRTDKSFPFNSYEIACRLGDVLQDKFPNLTADMTEPDIILTVEGRNKTYLYLDSQRGAGGLPVGVAGRGMLLLSGGIDSPVAGWMMAKRGLKLEGVHFHSYPYTSRDALEKTKKIAGILAQSQTLWNLNIVPFTKIQLFIKKKAPPAESTLLNRACMMKIAHTLALKHEAYSIITGESLSQVASQTQNSLRFTGSMTDLPVFRPLIGLDKEEIIKTAKDIGTYETSILPYEDCCTLFTPKHPMINPEYEAIRDSFHSLNLDTLMEEAVQETDRTFLLDR